VHPLVLARHFFYTVNLQVRVYYLLVCESGRRGQSIFFIRFAGFLETTFAILALYLEALIVHHGQKALSERLTLFQRESVSKHYRKEVKALRKLIVRTGWICFTLDLQTFLQILHFSLDKIIIFLLLSC